MRVAVLDDYHRVFEADPAIQRLRGRVPVDVYTEKLPLEKLRAYPILIALRERTRFDAAFFAALPGLELIAQTGNHAYHVDMAAATKAGVLVGMASSDVAAMGAIARSTIELTFGLMIGVLRRIPQTDQAMRRGEWPSFAGRTLAGKKLGILGLGRIGREVAQLARAFGMQVLAWGPTLNAERAERSGGDLRRRYRLLGAEDRHQVTDLTKLEAGVRTEIRGDISGRLIDTRTGAIVWSSSAWARRQLGHLNVSAEHGVSGAVKNSNPREEMVPALIYQLTPTFARRRCASPRNRPARDPYTIGLWPYGYSAQRGRVTTWQPVASPRGINRCTSSPAF